MGWGGYGEGGGCMAPGSFRTDSSEPTLCVLTLAPGEADLCLGYSSRGAVTGVAAA